MHLDYSRFWTISLGKFLEDNVGRIIRRVVGVLKPSFCLGMANCNPEAAVTYVGQDLPLDSHCSLSPSARDWECQGC